MNKNIGRNDPCPCGSGKKYKSCCMQKESDQTSFNRPPSGLKKFTAKIIASGAHKEAGDEKAKEQRRIFADYNALMERSFGSAIHENEEPPLPSSTTEYLKKDPS